MQDVYILRFNGVEYSCGYRIYDDLENALIAYGLLLNEPDIYKEPCFSGGIAEWTIETAFGVRYGSYVWRGVDTVLSPEVKQRFRGVTKTNSTTTFEKEDKRLKQKSGWENMERLN